jgi:hypothetical protein
MAEPSRKHALVARRRLMWRSPWMAASGTAGVRLRVMHYLWVGGSRDPFQRQVALPVQYQNARIEVWYRAVERGGTGGGVDAVAE